MWSERISAAKERGEFTLQDRRDAANWSFCAMSENPKIQRSTGLFTVGTPLNPRAKKLGLAFNEAVRRNFYHKAQKLLKEIMRLRT